MCRSGRADLSDATSEITRVDPLLRRCDRLRKILEEASKTDGIIEGLRESGIITGSKRCDHGRFELLRNAVRQNFEIPATNFSPAMERLLYAISANQQPSNILCIGIFCGNTLIWNVGAACGPGKCYDPNRLIGVEIREKYARMARDNLERIGVRKEVEILAEDGHDTIDSIDHPLDLLYLDALGPLPGTDGPETKKIYLTLLQRAYNKIASGGFVIAHDTLFNDFATQMSEYLDFVRDKEHFRDSVSLTPDGAGIELSVK